MATESPRIAELRRRVQADPASIAFAQLAEEYRRAGQYEEAVSSCRSGLARHPGYLSARVTLGRALSELGHLDDAAREFEIVLDSAPDNLAAIRGLAEIHQRRGALSDALDYYRRALELARFDPDLEETVTRIGREIGAVAAPPPSAAIFDEAPRSMTEPPTSEGSDAARSSSGNNVRADLIDFDALLAQLGVPDASPPPVMEMLLSQPAVAPPVPAAPATAPPPTPAAEAAFADLERELRALDRDPEPVEDVSASAVLDELEAWMRVLDNESDQSARN